ncbi:hypothetical protein AVEN_187943-1 [Araneus ventricosus]|uniref:RNase H type-1 domain-containing protein n=1 Tax=Araneus ventricosus TaxID=182803 RepID=A0A4Y2E248_ARAVE|nr:hypothetical protein AVEN_187943-1 [Araneus ventricosus]
MAALQVIKELLHLHLKAEQEAVYVRFTRFESHLKDQNFDPKDFEGKVSTVKFPSASFDLKRHVPFDHIFNTYEPINIYTDGSKIDDRTGCEFYVRENNISTTQCMTLLKPHSSVFQAELIAIKEAISCASLSKQPIKIWTDSDSILHSIYSLYTNSPLTQDIKKTLLTL